MDLERHLKTLEELLLSPDVRASAEALEGLLADEFIEFGSSGRVFDRRSIIAALSGAATSRYTVSEFHLRALCDDTALVTYRLIPT